MRRLGLLLSLALVGAVFVAGTAMAQEQDWADKGGAFGVGANTTLGGTNGINIRTYVTPQFGIHATIGMRFATATVEPEDVSNAETNYSMTEFDFGLYGSYKLAYWQRGHLSAMFGGDVQAFSETTEPPVGDNLERKSTNIVVGLGIMGEYFPTQYLSLFAQGGFTLDFLNDDDLSCLRADAGECASVSGLSGDPDVLDLSGIGLDLTGDLWGSAGFTIWFR